MSALRPVHFLSIFILSGKITFKYFKRNILENIMNIAVSGTLRIDPGVDVSEINPCKVNNDSTIVHTTNMMFLYKLSMRSLSLSPALISPLTLRG